MNILRNVFILFFVLKATCLFSVVYTSSQDGNWNDAATWGGGGTPGAGDDAVIEGGFRVIANQTVTINSLTIGSAVSNGNELQGVGGRTLTVTGTITINPATGGGAGLNWLDVRDGTMSCASISSGLSGADNIDCAVDIRDGYLTVAGDLTMDPASARSDINFTNTGNGTLDVGGDIITGTLRMRTISGEVGSRIINANSLTVGTTISVNHSGVGDVTGPARIDCPLILTNNRTVNVTGDGNDATEDLVISGVISDGGGDYRLTKSGDGSLTLSAANTFTDDVRLTAGKLNINNAQALGLGDSNDPLDIRGGIIDNTSGAPITIARAAGSMSYIVSADFTFAGTNDLNLNTGDVDLSADVTITCSAGILTMGGVVNEATQNLVKSGAGTLTFGSLDVTLHNLTISAGTLNPPTGAGILYLSGDLTNNSTLGTTTGTVEITGDGSQSISGSSTTSIYKLEKNGAGVLTLNSSVHVTNELAMTDGNINALTNPLVIEAGATSNEGNSSSYVLGSVQKVGNTDFVFPLGDETVWAPIGISNFLSGDGTTVFEASYSFTIHGSTTERDTSSVKLRKVSKVEYWDLSHVGGTAPTVDVTLYWKDQTRSGTEITGVGSDSLVVAHFNGAKWESKGQSALSYGALGSVSAANISSFSPFTFGSLAGTENDATPIPLPVELVSFSVEKKMNSNQLVWKTLTEINSDYFVVQGSSDGIVFKDVSKVSAAGNSVHVNEYVYDDYYSESTYYRLKQVDNDGTSSYSSVVVLQNSKTSNFSVFPNLIHANSNEVLTVILNAKNACVSIINSKGELLETKRLIVNGRKMQFTFNYPSGIYLLSIESDNQLYNEKIVVK